MNSINLRWNHCLKILKNYFNLNTEHTTLSNWIDRYVNYSFNLKYPVKGKPYHLIAGINGNLLSVNNGGLFLDRLPLIRSLQDNKLMMKYHLNFVFGVKFEKFILTYHIITNNEKNFTMDDPFWYVGDSFDLPEYEFLSNNYGVFRYLKISWIFLE